jgi:hypothetical protein
VRQSLAREGLIHAAVAAVAAAVVAIFVVMAASEAPLDVELVLKGRYRV